MSARDVKTVQSDVASRYVVRIQAHLMRLADGHDPLGHLFGVERLARAARAECWAALHGLAHERPDR